VRLLTGKPAELRSSMMADMGLYRYRVFVEKLGWELQCEAGLEYDQFDRDDTVYVVAQDDDGDIIGMARLLPTTRPYLLGEVFPQLMNGLPIPETEEVWELSRFVALDFKAEATTGSMQFSSPVAVNLLKESIAVAMSHGAKKLITVSPLGVERLLRKAGFKAYRAGPPMVIDGHAIFANWIDCEEG
jgi:acyl homoserine lactone synthase